LNFYCLDPGENAAAVKAAIDDGDGQILQTLRARCKDNIYIMTRSVSVNGLSSNSTVITVVPAWQTALIVANFVFALGTVVFTVLCAVAVCSDRKRKSALEVQ
jgi:hypothetical protein